MFSKKIFENTEKTIDKIFVNAYNLFAIANKLSVNTDSKERRKILKKLIFRIKMGLDTQEVEILTKAMNLYIFAGTTFDYPDEIEICKDVLRKIKRHLSAEYLPENTI